MKNSRYLLILFLFLTLCNCSQDNSIYDEAKDSSITSRSTTSDYSYFLNTETYISSSGETSTIGEIHCTKAGTYNILFAFNGSEGSSYFGYIGNTQVYPSNGSNFRTLNITLQPGIHKCSMVVLFSGVSQQAEARFYIQGINGISSGNYEGAGDLTAQGHSLLTDPVETIPMHWKCPKCGLLNGSVLNCLECGHESTLPDNF